MIRRLVLVSLAIVALAPNAVAAVRAGRVRIEVLTPTLFRIEYAQDGHFENRPTLMAQRTRLPALRYAARVTRRSITVTTARARLTYIRGGGPLAAGDLTLRWRATTAHPSSRPGNLGGWRRALDLLSGPVALNPGFLSTSGWSVIDDTGTAVLTRGAPGFTVRPPHAGRYQDWYVFAYGSDYRAALADLRALTGPAPLLPRTAFGVWFSRYWPYSEQDYHTLLGQFRANRVPLDTLSIDTDFKRVINPVIAAIYATIAGAPGRPYSWNSWEWDSALFPDPKRFTAWAHSQGLSLTVNIHPSISSDDPEFASAFAQAGGLGVSTGTCSLLMADPAGKCHVFDWTNPRQLAAYFALHQRFEQDGIDFFWLDWCCDASSASAPGLTADTWINSRYAALERARGQRWPAFARVGASYNESLPDDGDAQNGGNGIYAEHRYSIQFTGDTCATWAMLGFEARLSAEEGSVGIPYVSDDIGSFNGQPAVGQCSAQTGILNEHLPDDMYARWVGLGTFQPLDRLHSNHGDRLPWQYGARADQAAAGFLRLREALNPYLYTAARRTYDTGLPITGALYLQWPRQSGAFQHPDEYTFGPEMVVAPVTAGGDPAPATIWVPPGRWLDYFTGERFTGPSVRTLSVPLSQMPVLVRAGSIIATEPFEPYTKPGPQQALIVTAFGGGRGRFRLYDDEGLGFGYTRRKYSWTTITHAGARLTIAAAVGRFPGARRRRDWEVRFVGVRRPHAVSINGRSAAWSYDGTTLTVETGPVSTRRALSIVLR